MYQIKCDDYILYDPRDEDLILDDPKCKLEVNKVGEASFTIHASHPHSDKLKKMRSVFEILQDSDIIFRGRMTSDSVDFDNVKVVDIEGVMAYFNDSLIRPFVFPDDFENESTYKTAAASGNVVEYFLDWLIEQHNSQVQDFQKFKLGKVTVSDPNNYISRSATDFSSTWDVLKSKLFDSALGGYLCIRYEDDGNYIDYLSEFELTNTQRIVYGENLLDLSTESDATSIYTAIIPQGAKISEIEEGSKDASRLKIESLPDGELTDDIVKDGDTLYSKSGIDEFGWIYAPPKDTTWEDITLVDNLKQKGIEFFGDALKYTNTIEISAVDLHFSDEEIEGFRIYRNILTYSKPHHQEGIYKLTKLDIDILNPQNTKITLGETQRSMTDINAEIKAAITTSVQVIKNEVSTEVKQVAKDTATSVLADSEKIIVAAVENYIETGNFSEFRETVSAQLSFLAEQMALIFTETTSRIEEVDGDLQEKFNTVTKYFAFDINGLTIGQADNPNKVVIDNDEMSILVNNVVVQKFDAEGHALIPELTVTRKFDLFGYVMEQDSEGRVNCEYMGG